MARRPQRHPLRRHPPRPQRTPAAAPAPAPTPPAPGQDYLKPLTKLRKGIAAQMTRANAVPTAYETVEVDMSAVIRLRDKTKRAYQEREGISLSFVAFVSKASVEALRKQPDLNSPLDRGRPLDPLGHQPGHRGGGGRRPDGARGPRRGQPQHPRPQPGHQRGRGEDAQRQAQGDRHRRGHVHGGQHRLDRVDPDDAHPQRARGRHPDHGGHRQEAGGHRVRRPATASPSAR